jgi:hypothetical protein
MKMGLSFHGYSCGQMDLLINGLCDEQGFIKNNLVGLDCLCKIDKRSKLPAVILSHHCAPEGGLGVIMVLVVKKFVRSS